MRKQFDLNYYLEHPDTKVVTREGNNVRIICTDAKKEYFIVALVEITEIDEEVACYECDGKGIGYVGDNFDLFFDLPEPEKKRVPLTHEDLLQRVKEGKTMWTINDRDTVFR